MFDTLDLRDKITLGLLLVFLLFSFSQISPSKIGENTWKQRRGLQAYNKSDDQDLKNQEANPSEPEKISPIEKLPNSISESKKEDSKSKTPSPDIKPPIETPKVVESESKPAPKIDNSFVQNNPIRSDESKEKPKAVESKEEKKPKSTPKIDNSYVQENPISNDEDEQYEVRSAPVPYEISGLSGRVTINSQPVYTTSDLDKNFTELSSIVTDSDSWVIISTGNKGELVVFPNTELYVNGQVIELKEGKVLNRSSYFTRHKIDVLTIHSNAINPEFVYFTEPGKARIFALSSDISISGFDNIKKVRKGFGASVFILNRQINVYNLKNPVTKIQIQGTQLSWKANSESKVFYVLSKHFLNNEKSWNLSITTNNSVSLPEAIDEIRIYYDNKYDTWSMPGIK